MPAQRAHATHRLWPVIDRVGDNMTELLYLLQQHDTAKSHSLGGGWAVNRAKPIRRDPLGRTKQRA